MVFSISYHCYFIFLPDIKTNNPCETGMPHPVGPSCNANNCEGTCTAISGLLTLQVCCLGIVRFFHSDLGLNYASLLDAFIFSSPELKAQVSYCDHSPSVVVIVRMSVRPSVCLSVLPQSLNNISS